MASSSSSSHDLLQSISAFGFVTLAYSIFLKASAPQRQNNVDDDNKKPRNRGQLKEISSRWDRMNNNDTADVMTLSQRLFADNYHKRRLSFDRNEIDKRVIPPTVNSYDDDDHRNEIGSHQESSNGLRATAESDNSNRWGSGQIRRGVHPHFEDHLEIRGGDRRSATSCYVDFTLEKEMNKSSGHNEPKNHSYIELRNKRLIEEAKRSFESHEGEEDASYSEEEDNRRIIIANRRLMLRSIENDTSTRSSISTISSENDMNENITMNPTKPLKIKAERRPTLEKTTSLNTFELKERNRQNVPLRPRRDLSRGTSLRTLHEDDGDYQSLYSSFSQSCLSSRVESARTKYNSEIMPRKLVLIRHGESEGNINRHLYQTKADHKLNLTKLGWDQAKMAGKALKNQILKPEEEEVEPDSFDDGCHPSSVHFIISPYSRTVETFHGLASAWCDPDVEFKHITNEEERLSMWYARLNEMGVTWHQDPRIREQDFGNYQDPQAMLELKKERHKFGSFYYRFPNGESGADVYDRVSTFLDSLWRSFDLNRSKNFVLVTHGVSVRVLLTRYFRYAVEEFDLLQNPKNCEMIILAHDGSGKLKLDGRCNVTEKEVEEDIDPADAVTDDDGTHNSKRMRQKKVVGYKFHEKLKTIKNAPFHYRVVRMSSSCLDEASK